MIIWRPSIFGHCSTCPYSTKSNFSLSSGLLTRGLVVSRLRLCRLRGYRFNFRRQHHHELTAFHLRPLLDLSILHQIQLQPLQHPYADILVRHLATPEAQRDLGLVTLVEKLDQIAQLDVVITIIGAWPKFYFLDQNDLLLELGFVGFFLFRILELAVVHEPCNGRLRRRRDFHQIDIRFFREAKGIGQTHDTKRFILDPTQPQFRCSDFTVDAVRLISSYCNFLLRSNE